MAAVSYLDTHVAAWLFAGEVTRFSAPARTAIESGDLLIAPAVMLELQYLYETKRVADSAEALVSDLQHRVMLRVCDLPFPDVARHALTISWIRDPFNRLIVAQAAARDARLITKDRVPRKRYSAVLWWDLARGGLPHSCHRRRRLAPRRRAPTTTPAEPHPRVRDSAEYRAAVHSHLPGRTRAGVPWLLDGAVDRGGTAPGMATPGSGQQRRGPGAGCSASGAWR